MGMEFWQDLDFLGPAGVEIVDIMEDRGIHMVVDEGRRRADPRRTGGPGARQSRRLTESWSRTAL